MYKSIPFFIIFAALVVMLVGCSQNEFESPKELEAATRAEEKPVDIDYTTLDTLYFVSDKDVEAYIHFKKLVAEGEKREFDVREVVPMGKEAILCYLINYNDGWEIISADKRATTVLASDSTGQLNLSSVPEGVVLWIECLAADVLSLRASSDRPQNIADEVWDKMLKSIEFWEAINASSEYIARKLAATRGDHDLIIIDPTWEGGTPGGDPQGHWELVNVVAVYEQYDGGSRLTDTQWCQSKDFNQFCPTETVYPGNHARAGCSAVAAA